MRIGDFIFEHNGDGTCTLCRNPATTGFTPDYYGRAIETLRKLNKPTIKENNMTNTFITIDGTTYKACGGTMKLGPGEFCEIEVETCMCPSNKVNLTPQIKDVIFNPPATIVFWSDNTKTIVKALEGDAYDPEKGIAMAISKKMLGNKYDYYHTFQRYLKKWDKQQAEETANK